MGQFVVEGIGTFEIEGDTPSIEEQMAIDEVVARSSENLAETEANQEPAPPPPTREPMGMEHVFGKPEDQMITGRDVFTAGGAMVGEGLALAAGQVPPLTAFPEEAVTIPVAGALGAGAGSAAYDLGDAFIRGYYGEPDAHGGDPLGPTKQVGKAMRDETLGAGLAKGLGKAFGFGKKMLAKALGTEDVVTKELAQLAETYDVPLGISHASSRPVVKGTSRVVGVVPFVGGPFKKASKAVDQSLETFKTDMLDALAPRATMTNLGVDFTKQAGKKWKQFETISSALYERVFQLARSLPIENQAIIPTRHIKQVAQMMIDQNNRGLITKVGGDIEKDVVTKNPILSWAEEVLEYPGTITLDQFKGKSENLRTLMKVADKAGYGTRHGIAFKEALEQDLNSPFLNFAGEVGPKIQRALERANNFYNTAIKRFETPTAKKFGRVDKGLLKGGYEDLGFTNADELFPALMSSRGGVQGLKDLRTLIGKEKFRQGARVFVENAIEAAFQNTKKTKHKSVESLNPDKLKKTLGLDSPEGLERLTEVLDGTGLRVKHLEDFTKMLDANKSFFTPDTSVFLQRRVTLGGLGSLWAAGKAGQKSVLGGLVTLSIMRKGAEVLSNPINLQTMTKAFEDTAPKSMRRRAVLRLVRELGDADPLMEGDAKRWEKQFDEWEAKGGKRTSVDHLQGVVLSARPELRQIIDKAIQNQ